KIKDLENVNEVEKKKLENAINDLKSKLQEKITAETGYQELIKELGSKINELEQQIHGLNSLSEATKQQLGSELTDTKQELKARNDLINNLEESQKELNQQIVSLNTTINSLQKVSQEEKNVLSEQIKVLKNAKL